MDNTDGVSRESTLSSRGFIWPWNDITTRWFRGNRSICLRIDGAEAVYDHSHHMCQNPICQQLKGQHIRQHLFPTTLFVARIMHKCVRGFAALDWLTLEILLQRAMRGFLLRKARQQARTVSVWPWHVRTTSADEPNVTCWVSGITGRMGSSIITSLMGLECSQSFMTLCFIALDLRTAMRRL